MVLSAATRFPTLPIIASMRSNGRGPCVWTNHLVRFLELQTLPGGRDRAEGGEETGNRKTKMRLVPDYFFTRMRAQGAAGSDRAVVFVFVTWPTWLLPFLLIIIITLTLNRLSHPVTQTSDLSCKCESLLLCVKIPLAVFFLCDHPPVSLCLTRH